MIAQPETTEPRSTESPGWQKDALNRKPLSQHLTRTLVGLSNHHAATLARGTTVSLDGDWGSGKTFFVQNWADDLRTNGYPTIYFDAWKNDIGDEASVALMSAILAGLDEWRAKLPKNTLLRTEAEALKKRTIDTLRKAILPASKVIAKGLVKKLSGIAVDEIIDVFDDSTTANSGGDNSALLDQTLDQLFQRTLEEHQSRQAALESFRNSLAKLLLLFQEHTDARLPLFIFVDELDRCRPSYAVKLLEEIKHIFGIENVCYVVSTNISQLQESVKALYGPSFDGRRYLKRLFDREYHLPAPDIEKHVGSLISTESILKSRTLSFGLPHTLEGGSISAQYALSLIFDAFNLDLRSQKQVFSLIEDVAAALPPDHPIHFTYLSYFCALNFKNSEALDEIAHSSAADAKRDLKNTLPRDIPIRYSVRHRGGDSYGDDIRTASTALSELLTKYHAWSLTPYRKLFDSYNNVNSYDYPNSILAELVNELSGRPINDTERPLLIAKYPLLVRNAGFLSSD